MEYILKQQRLFQRHGMNHFQKNKMNFCGKIHVAGPKKFQGNSTM